MSQQRRMHGPGGGMGAIEKSKRGIRGIFRELFTYSSKLKVPMAIALLLAAVGAVLTIVGPNQLADITNLISDGLMTGIDLAAILAGYAGGKLAKGADAPAAPDEGTV